MRKNLLAAAILAAGLAAAAHAQPMPDANAAGFGSPEDEYALSALVVSVREVVLADDPFVHSVQPELAVEVLVRLGDGREVVVVQPRTRIFLPGDRARLLRGERGPFLM